MTSTGKCQQLGLSHSTRTGTYKPSGSMRPRMLCSRTALWWRPDNRDDIVDALGLAGQLLDMWAPGGVPKLEPDAFRPRPLTMSHYTHGLTIRC